MRVQIVQIGLGTNARFIQNLAKSSEKVDECIAWLLQSVGNAVPTILTGVAVEPVLEHVQALRPLVENALPGVSLVQCAIWDADRESQLYFIPMQAHGELLQQEPSSQRWGAERDLSYLLNMSCVDREHPLMAKCLESLKVTYGLQLKVEQANACVWS